MNQRGRGRVARESAKEVAAESAWQGVAEVAGRVFWRILTAPFRVLARAFDAL